jgi:hypothetical protein
LHQDLLVIGEMLRIPKCLDCSKFLPDMAKDSDTSTMKAAVKTIRKMFGKCIIRRDLFSLGPDGKRISDLKKYHVKVLRMNAQKWESEHMAELVLYDKKTATKTGVVTHVRRCSPG